MKHLKSAPILASAAAAVAVSAFALTMSGELAHAVDIAGVQPAALDQPRINAYVARNPGGPPLIADLGGGIQTFNITAFFDTGASGILISPDTAELLGIATLTHNNKPVIFSDVGVGGTSDFYVSEQLHIGLSRYHPEADVDDLKSYATVYNQTYGPMRAHIGPLLAEPDPILRGLDVFGTPLMGGKVFVMDPKPVNTFVDTMRTYVYNPGTPFNPTTADSDPGIPVLNNPETSRHIKLSQGTFDRFTQTTPPGAPMPTLFENPFIGPNPVLQLEPNPPPDNTPPVKVSFGGITRPGSFLFDTGAAASIMSEGLASQLNVFVDDAQPGNPILRDQHGAAVPDQFQITVGGTGGTIKVPGFFLDSMLVPTMEGDPTNDDDPNHIRFQGAPVLVFDISLEDPITHQQLTLDGVFGMNYLTASAFVTEAEPFPIISDLTFGAFDWAVYDHDAGVLGLEMSLTRPAQLPLLWLGSLDPTGDWDTTSQNWIDISTFNFEARYKDGDYVLFTNQVTSTTVNIAAPVAPGGVIFDNSGSYNYTLTGAPIQGETGLVKQGTGTLTLLNQNTYQGTTDIQNGTIVFAARQDIGLVGVRAQGVAQINASQTFAGLDVAGGRALVAPGGNKVLVLGSVEVTNNGTIDLSDNAMIVDKRQTPLADVRDLLVQGRDGNTWAGPGINSSTAAADPARFALGMADNAVLGRTTFLGEAVDANSILVRYTRVGDANLDGIVNLQDFNRLAANFGMSDGAFWHHGDFTYDGIVNLQDFNRLAASFGLSASGPEVTPEDWAALASAVPEPGMSLLLLSSLGVVGLRRARARNRGRSLAR